MKIKTVAAAALLILAGAFFYFRAHCPRPLVLSGTVESHEIRLGSRVGGRVLEVLIQEGDIVKTGEILVKFDLYDLSAREKQAEAVLEEAEADYEKMRHGPRRQEIDQARSDLAGAQADYENALVDFNRVKSLYRGGFVSRQQYDSAGTAAKEALAKRNSLHEHLQLLLAGTRKEEIESAEAAVRSARANVKALQAQLRETLVRSPADAVVETLDIRPGDLISPNTAIATLLESNQLYVKVYIPETKLGWISLHQPVSIRVDSFPNRVFSGTVEQIATEGEFTPRNIQTNEEREYQVFAVKIKVQNEKGMLRSGMAADVIVNNRVNE